MQIWRDNMSIKEEAKITQNTKLKDYTCITFWPDLAKFKMSSLDDDIVSLFSKRIYDMAGIVSSKLKVTLNDQ